MQDQERRENLDHKKKEKKSCRYQNDNLRVLITLKKNRDFVHLYQ